MYKTYYLKNGICLVYEEMPYLKSVSVGIWVKSGSMYETKEESGISHFNEHMLFKGTKNRTARRIAEEMDFAGGQINAYTARECTCYYTKTLGDNMSLSLDVLSDMYYNSLFSDEDIELERGVIIEEINMYEDSPEDVALDAVCELMWADNPLGYRISGTVESVSGISRSMMLDYFNRRYTPENTVISVAGCFDEAVLIELCEKYFSKKASETPFILKNVDFVSGEWRRKKDIEQAHLSIAYPAFEHFSDRIYSLSLLNNILGGSMSSRLFQSLRENNGLCYSIYSYTGAFEGAGMLGIYAGLSADMLSPAQKMIDEEIENLCSNAISDYELEKARSQLKCAIIMSRESASSRMSENGRTQLLLGKVRTDDEIIKKVSAITPKDIMRDANDVFNSGKKAVFILEN